MSTRLCGPDCPYPDTPHLAPEPDWIGDTPILHGERDGWGVGQPNTACLCGCPDYIMCPRFMDGIATMVIGDPYGGRL